MAQSDLEWPRAAMEIVWMTQYDFRWVKSTSASLIWGPSDLNISIYSGSVTSQRETTILWDVSIYFGLQSYNIIHSYKVFCVIPAILFMNRRKVKGLLQWKTSSVQM